MGVSEASPAAGVRYALQELRRPPNLVTASRLVIVLGLWEFALAGNATAVGIGLALAFVTDVADGRLARRLGQASSFGSKLDSLVDATVGPSAIVWILLLRPEVVTTTSCSRVPGS